MSIEKELEVSVQKLAGTYLRDIISIYPCEVISVDKGNRQCDCTPIGSDSITDLPGVLLCAENNNGLVVFPKVGSTVIVALSTRNYAFVLMYSDIDSVQFMDGTYGGMVKLLDPQDTNAGVLARLNKIESLLNGFITIYNTHTHAVSGAATAVPNQLETQTANPTTQAQLENTLITHGKN